MGLNLGNLYVKLLRRL